MSNPANPPKDSPASGAGVSAGPTPADVRRVFRETDDLEAGESRSFDPPRKPAPAPDADGQTSP